MQGIFKVTKDRLNYLCFSVIFLALLTLSVLLFTKDEFSETVRNRTHVRIYIFA
jgi:hypothetical protein